MTAKPSYEELEKRLQKLDTERRKTERQSGERQEFLKSVIQTTADGFLVIDSTGIVTEINDAYCSMSGYSREALLGKHIGEFDATESEADTKARIEEVRRKGTLIFESLHLHVERGTFPVEISASHISSEQNSQFVCFCRDLTIRRQQEDRFVSQSEMLDAAPVAILVHDKDGKLLYSNTAAHKMHGYESRKTFMQLNLLDLLVAEAQAQFSDWIKKFSETKELRFESNHIHRDGHLFPVDVVVRLTELEGQQAYLSINIDISEQKEAREKVTYTNDLLRYIIEHANSAIAVHDRDLHYVYVSDNYLEQYKVTESEVIGRHHYEVFPDLPQKWRDVHQKALQGEVSGEERDHTLGTMVVLNGLVGAVSPGI